MRNILMALGCLLLVFTLSACTGGVTPAGDLEEISANRKAVDVPEGEPIVDGEYRLGSGDKLRIIVFEEPDLSGEFVVDGTGTMAMPLIGQVVAQGQTVREVEDLITTKLQAGYLNNPRVSAEVVTFRPYFILGEVNTPGTYPSQAGLTVIEAAATAGGFTYRANKKTIFIRRAGTDVETPVALTTTTRVYPGDTVRIGERLF